MESLNETQNHIKISLLINDKGSRVLRKTFQELWFDIRKKEWGNGATDGLDLITGVGKNVYIKEMRIQKDNLKSGNINTWDFPLLVKLINQLHDHQVPSPTEGEKSKFNALTSLVPIRNKLAHAGSSTMSDEEYEANWKTISEVLEKFGLTENDLDAVQTFFSMPEVKKTTTTTPVNEENAQLAQKLKDEGNKLLKNGDIHGAIGRYSEALLLSNIPIEDQAILYSNRSKAYIDLEISEEVENAIEDAKQAINLRPQWWKGYFRAAVAYEYSGEFQQAIKFYNMTLALEPTENDIITRMGICQFKKSLAKINSKYIYRSVHECIETYLEETIPNKGIIKEDTKKEAKKKLMTEDSYLGLIVKGHMHRVAEKFEEAAAFFTRALDMRKNGNAEALYNLALLKIGQKLKNSKVSDAIKLLEKAAVQLSRGNFGVSESEFILGLYYQEAVKDYKKACDCYERSAMGLNGLAANQLGIMREEGVVLMKNMNAAVEYWKIAAISKHKVVSAMESLSRYYLQSKDFESADEWHKTAVENGSIILSESKKAFKSDLEELKICAMNLKMCRLLEERADLQELQMDERAKMLNIKMDVTISRMLLDYFKYKLEDTNTPAAAYTRSGRNYSSLTSNSTIKKLQKAVENGNEMSKILLQTHEHYTNALHYMEYEDINDELSFTTAINELGSAISLEHSFITTSIETCSKLWQKLKLRIPKANSQNSDLDRNLRFCYCYLNSRFDPSNFDRILFYAKESAKKYPDEAYFPFIVGSMYGFKQDFSEGVKITNKALTLIPNNHSLLYNKAALGMHCKHLSPEKGIQPYLDFIESAPIGYRKIPEAYYTIALFYKEMHTTITTPNSSRWGKVEEELYENFVKYVELGQRSEETLAPCYLPYNDNFKKDALDASRVFKLVREAALNNGRRKLMQE